MLLTNHPLRAEMGRNARRIAETEYSWPCLIERLEALYQRVLTQSHR
jgi:glycosyltransferase involved in cell wall biosynthesis